MREHPVEVADQTQLPLVAEDRESALAVSLRNSQVPSSEPLSAATTSKSPNDCARMLATHSGRKSIRLYVGRQTLTRGVIGRAEVQRAGL
jgi:hypothetical protein